MLLYRVRFVPEGCSEAFCRSLRPLLLELLVGVDEGVPGSVLLLPSLCATSATLPPERSEGGIVGAEATHWSFAIWEVVVAQVSVRDAEPFLHVPDVVFEFWLVPRWWISAETVVTRAEPVEYTKALSKEMELMLSKGKRDWNKFRSA